MIGKTLAHYEIVEKIGAGGMGEVYRATDTKLGRDVALKVLPPDLTGDATRRQRFEREARSVAALNHPNVITLHSVEEIDGVHLITMELVDAPWKRHDEPGRLVTHLRSAVSTRLQGWGYAERGVKREYGN